MNYGLYLSASGLLSATYRQDVATNNLANVNTTGFKVHIPTVRQRADVRSEDGLGYLDSNALLEKLGGGVQMAPTAIDFSQGDLKASRNALDVAIEGDGFFLLSSGRSGDTESVQLSRDGRFTLAADGRLVSSTTGMSVLSTGNNPIRVDPRGGDVRIDLDGTVSQGGVDIARIQVADVPDRSALIKIGDNLYETDAVTIENRFETGAAVRQGYTEASGVNEISAISAIRSASGDASSNAEMIRNHDRIMDLAISRLGRVS